ncbi:MAG: hypothetical protein K2M19_08720 [Muribaculaceae bacterium]|nr:hypothetical protein [Muribaculaceae bacterium]
MKYYKLIFALIALSMTSCIGIYNRMSHLNEDELEWVTNCKPGDKAYFYSDRGNIETLKITELEIHNSRNPFYFYSIDHDPGNYRAKAFCKFNLNGKNTDLKGRISVSKDAKTDELGFHSFLGRMQSHYTARIISDDTADYDLTVDFRPQTFVINKKTITDCIVVNLQNSSNLATTDDVEEFVVSKHYGLIKYTKPDGEVFIRKIP